jgi:hypothetical protein
VSAFRKLAPTLILLGLLASCSGGSGNSSTRSVSATPTQSLGPSGSGTARPNGLPADRVTFYGANAGDHAASIVTGDFNGDGFMDVALGAASANGPGNNPAGAGAVYVFFGPFAPGSSLDAAAAQYDAVFYGANAGDGLGRTLAVGDFNGDGVDDLVMAAPAANGGAGRTYVMFGGTWPRETNFAAADPDVLLSGGAAGDYAGFTLASADLEGGKKSDLIVGAMLADGPQRARPDSGEVYVLSGSDLVPGSNIDLEKTRGIIYGARTGDRLGEGLTTGDVNGDGKPDLILAATFSAGPDGSRAASGETYVITSPAALPLDLASGGAAMEVLGTASGDQLGHSVGAGDTTGSGAADIWLGAPSANGPGNTVNLSGEAALVTGKRPPGTVIDSGAGQANAIIYGPETESRLGRSLAVGDLNGDHLADLAISAPNLDARAGRVFIFYAGGSFPNSTSAANVVLYGLDPGDILGFEAFGMPSLSIADVDKDGLPDLLVSAPGGSGPRNDRPGCGEAYLIWGKTLGR